MIIKHSENYRIKKNNFYLFYGKNSALKDETLKENLKFNENNLYYEEKDILDNKDNFIETILTNSLFENEKIIIIKRATDKLLDIIKYISDKRPENLTIILNSENLDTKSKLRSFFEKDKICVCTPFYPDNQYTLLKLSNNILNRAKIKLSQSNINFIINKSKNDRQNLKNNLLKIENYSKNRKQINHDILSKLINLNEEEDITKLVDSCLAKNKKDTINILNENNYSNEDGVTIIRIFLNKLKKLLNLVMQYKINQNIELTISSSRPPIFWKDKEIISKQIKIWTVRDLKKLIYRTNELEVQIKKDLKNSTKIIYDFLIEQASKTLVM